MKINPNQITSQLQHQKQTITNLQNKIKSHKAKTPKHNNISTSIQYNQNTKYFPSMIHSERQSHNDIITMLRNENSSLKRKNYENEKLILEFHILMKEAHDKIQSLLKLNDTLHKENQTLKHALQSSNQTQIQPQQHSKDNSYINTKTKLNKEYNSGIQKECFHKLKQKINEIETIINYNPYEHKDTNININNHETENIITSTNKPHLHKRQNSSNANMNHSSECYLSYNSKHNFRNNSKNNSSNISVNSFLTYNKMTYPLKDILNNKTIQ